MRLKIASVLLIFSVTLLAQAPAQDASIAREIHQLRKAAGAQPPSDDWNSLKARVMQSLDLADRAARAGRNYLALEEMGRAMVVLEANQEAAQSAEAGLKQFEKAWSKASVQLVADDQKARQWDWGSAPAAVRAIGETAQGESLVLLEAARAYAGATQPQAGYFYVGQAKAQAHLAQFAHTLELRVSQTSAPRDVSDEIRDLQQQINAEFQPPKSIERHSDFIVLNATLKLAGDLNRQKFYAGALYKYLAAVQLLAMLDRNVPAQDARGQLRDAVAAARKALNAKRDDSIAQIFVERAETLVISDAQPSDADWANAQAIVRKVLPAYEAAVAASRQPKRQAASLVRLTLVRWPYT
ncbi:MAG TPA: hypothetical protein VFU76_13545 [Terriglobales bacterium]|nr:hypothetical protein [Terriglobales bacterium]